MLNEEQKAYLGRLCTLDAALADARRLTQDFTRMVRNLAGEKLDGWLEEAAGLVTPLAHRRLSLAASLGPDEMAYTEDGRISAS